MQITKPLALLGGLSPQQFMKRHWHKKPLVVRAAVPGFSPLLERAELFALAARDDVESRIVVQGPKGWKMRSGPLPRRGLPPLSQRQWSLLVQGVDLHDDRVHALLQQFRFIPDARLDDLMVSYASDGGGVGPHFDSYDVFLLQAQGRRRWRIGRQRDLTLRGDVPLKVLAHFEPELEFVLEPGDMLYLPPRYAHDGVALGECQTYSIGFRSPAKAELARELMQRIADDAADEGEPVLYRDPKQEAAQAPARIPETLQDFARGALSQLLDDPLALARSLGEYLTEPKANVWFDTGTAATLTRAISLDRRTRMMHDGHHIFINGESYLASGRDAALMNRLADDRRLPAVDLRRASTAARELLLAWSEAGWLHETQERV